MRQFKIRLTAFPVKEVSILKPELVTGVRSIAMTETSRNHNTLPRDIIYIHMKYRAYDHDFIDQKRFILRRNMNLFSLYVIVNRQLMFYLKIL